MADTIKTNLGPVTAYADAKAHGYTGTREEFGVLLANAGLNLKAAEAAKEGAEAAKQAAETAQQAAAENQKSTETQAANAKAAADAAANAAVTAKQAQQAAETAKADAAAAKTTASNSADAAVNSAVAAKESETNAGQSATAATKSAADAKNTLESIPADYSKLSGKVNDNTSGIRELKKDLSNKITKFYASNQGETHLADSDNGKIMDMMVYGKSSQDGTPTPDNPVEIKSVVNPKVKVSNEDGTKSQTVTLPYTLNAILVSSGGNVTIDRQQYIADYVDVERGKLVRMVDTVHPKSADDMSIYTGIKENFTNYRIHVESADKKGILSNMLLLNRNIWEENVCGADIIEHDSVDFSLSYEKLGINSSANSKQREIAVKTWLENNDLMFMYIRRTSNEIDLTPEEVQAFKALATYYPVTNISVNSEQLDGYTVFNYPISMANGWNYVKKQLNDNRDYIYDMDTRTQDMDIQSAEAYVNSEYAVALAELEV